MESIPLSEGPGGIRIDGFPEAVKVIALTGPKAKRLADLSLHGQDLRFALECLDALNSGIGHSRLVRTSLWHGILLHYFKCFGSSAARFSLKPRAILKGDPEGFEIFQHYQTLRNKHLVHDENSYLQGLPGAVINNQNAGLKVAKIVTVNTTAVTLNQTAYSNLHLLITKTLQWVEKQFNSICDDLTVELENVPFEDLVGRAALTVVWPDVQEIAKSRHEAPRTPPG